MWDKIKFLASSLWDFFRPMIRLFLTAIGPLLAETARSAVNGAAAKAISSTEKRDFAFKQIVLAMERQGFKLGEDFSARMVNAAIEAAVAGLSD